MNPSAYLNSWKYALPESEVLLTFSVEFRHFIDSRRNGVLRGALGSSLGGSFLMPRITYFDWFGLGGSET